MLKLSCSKQSQFFLLLNLDDVTERWCPVFQEAANQSAVLKWEELNQPISAAVRPGMIYRRIILNHAKLVWYSPRIETK